MHCFDGSGRNAAHHAVLLRGNTQYRNEQAGTAGVQVNVRIRLALLVGRITAHVMVMVVMLGLAIMVMVGFAVMVMLMLCVMLVVLIAMLMHVHEAAGEHTGRHGQGRA
jgi:hypothetical protein